MLYLSYIYYLYFLVLIAFVGCGQSEDNNIVTIENIDQSQNVSALKSCNDCHPYSLDPNHSFACTKCHKGNSSAKDETSAHLGLVFQPASPLNMAKICGSCHLKLVEHAAKSKHFTLSDEINLVRQAFGAKDHLDNPLKIPQVDEPDNLLSLADDLLRRRCLRCHVYSSGDQYSAVEHGTGCAACHLKFSSGSLVSHKFIKLPDDQICLSCHYGNYVGADYYGLYEHDFNWEYQTPFATEQSEQLSHGLNYHKLRPDIHLSAGIACIDCHHGNQIMGEVAEISSCLSCHLFNKNSFNTHNNIINSEDNSSNPIVLLSKISQIEIEIPQIKENHHNKKISCQVCHAQWSFADYGTHLFRLDAENYDPWFALTKQGSSEVEQLLEYNLFYDNEEIPPFMTDKFTGEQKTGTWLKGFELRRWENIPTCLDDNQILQVCRPILDLHLSYSDKDDVLIINSATITPTTSIMQPYSPHTIGKADIFRIQRIDTKKYFINNNIKTH